MGADIFCCIDGRIYGVKMNRWIKRQFNDGFVEYPQRFNLKNPDNGDIIETVELEFSPGEVYQLGNMVSHRGHWQPIEDFLAEIDIDYWIKFLSDYAKKDSANFINPKSNTVAAMDNSLRIATTNYIREYLKTFPFPPKNVKNILASTYVVEGIAQTFLGWYNPVDFVFDSMALSQWQSTKLVYRPDRYPANENDGTVLATNTIRPAQATYEESDAEPGLRYYQFFPLGTNGAYNRNVTNRAFIRVSGMTSATNLSVARYELAAATDGNGNVLFGGGYQSGGYSSVVDKIDMNNQRTTFSLSRARGEMAASTDGNGAVLFGGGVYIDVGFVVSNIIDKFDLNNNRTILNLSQARSAFSSTTDGNGNVWFAGGGNLTYEPLATIDKFDSSGNRTILSLINARAGLAAATYGNGHVVFGGGAYGQSNDYKKSDFKDKFDLNNNRTISYLVASRDSLAAATDGNGSVLFGGGVGNNKAKWYVDKTDSYGNLTVLYLSQDISVLSAATDKGGNVLFGGGMDYYLDAINVINKFDLNGNRVILSLETERSGLAAATDGNGNVLFGGGVTDSSHLATIEKWIPQ